MNVFRIMKIILLFLFVGIGSAFSGTYSQNTKISLEVNQQSIREIFNKIEKQTEYVFFYSDHLSKELTKKVDLNASSETIHTILDDLFEGTGLSYDIHDRQVTIQHTPVNHFLDMQQAQTRSISGIVVETLTDDPIIGANVVEKGTNNGVMTDIDGAFKLTVNPGATLVISYIGYVTQEISVSTIPSDLLHIRLAEDTQMLDEVVVVGYGIQKKVSTVAAITTTKSDELLKGGYVNSVSEALQGRLNGVVAMNTNAKPGANTADIYIRGKSSWNNTNPLILVDGVERNFNDVDMEQIESISVLKDASATAVYGVRGANGVILLTTKRGTNQKASVRFTSSVGFKTPTAKYKWPDYLHSMTVYNEAVANDNAWNSLIPQSTFDAWQNAYATGNYGPYNEVFPEVDWFDTVMKDFGTTQHYGVTVDGGNDFMRYFVSLSYLQDGDIYNLKKQDDYDPRSMFRRYNWRSNLDFNLTKTTTFSVNIAGKVGYRQEKWAGDGDIYTKILRAPTNNFPIKYENGYWGDTEAGGYNILANMYGQGQNSVKSSQNWYDFSLKQELGMILKGLSATVKVSYNSYIDTSDALQKGKILGENAYNASLSVIRYHKKYDYANPIVNANGTITYPLLLEKRLPDENKMDDLPIDASYDNITNNVGDDQFYEFSLFYENSFGDHNVTALGLVNRSIKKYKQNDVLIMQFPEYREDWVGRLTYNFKQRYLAEFNISHTGSEKFAPGRRFGTFPSYSVGWRLSEEPFMKKIGGDKLSNLKLRYSYGIVGSDAGAQRFNYIQTYNQEGGVVYGDGTGVNTGFRYVEGNIAYPYATWETATKQNIGIELGLWNKLNITLDLFDEKRKGILMAPRDYVFWFAATSNSQNIGKTKNHGLELESTWNDKIGKDWRYSIGYNFAVSENRIVYRGDPNDLKEYQKDAGKPIGWLSRYIAVGNYGSIDDVYNYAQTAISGASTNRIQPGDLIYIDYNNDGIINSNDQVISANLNYPLTTHTLNLGLSYKNISLSAMLYAPLGQHKMYWGVVYFDFPEGNLKAQPESVNRWTRETANSSGVRRPTTHLREYRTHNDVDNSLRFIDYSYLRLKTLELSYELPTNLLKRLHISSCRVFFNGNNLLTFSDIDERFDPETNTESSYPIVKTYAVGLNLGF